MYYLTKKQKLSEAPKFDWELKGFDEFYELAKITTVPILGTYYIKVKSDNYNDIIHFIDTSDQYSYMVIYVEVSESLLKYIALRKPHVSLLNSKTDFEIWLTLIEKYELLFDKKVHILLYNSISHDYQDMVDALELLKDKIPHNILITKSILQNYFVLDTIVYPRTVLMSYLRMDRFRKSKLKTCINDMGNDLVFYSMRKTLRKLLTEKIAYLKSGTGPTYIKGIPIENIVKMLYLFDYDNRHFHDVYTLLNMYEKGDCLNDYLRK